MWIDGHEFVLDRATKFEQSIYIMGWHNGPSDLCNIEIVGYPGSMAGLHKDVSFDHLGVIDDLGPGRGFSLQVLFDSVVDPLVLHVVFITMDGARITVKLGDLCADRLSREECYSVSQNFIDSVNESHGKRILDIGGRSRSRLERKNLFPNLHYEVLDIIAGENVDYVGDAHRLSEYFQPDTFDYIMSVSVFEHLAMPWRVVLEMNKVLKPGGLVFIHTHQTIGIHDDPWDFYRFSSYAWETLFNRFTGYEIVKITMGEPTYILPFVYRQGKINAEWSAGYESSLCIARKISETDLAWPAPLDSIIETSYPDRPDSLSGEAGS